jgi:archaellum component FlaC
MALTKNDLYQALGAKLKPVNDSLDDIKKQLNLLNTTVNNLDIRVKAIETKIGKKPMP